MKSRLFAIILLVPLAYCQTVPAGVTGTAKNESVTGQKREARVNLADFAACALMKSPDCLLDAADDFLEEKRVSLIAEADQMVMAKSVGRAENETPSKLISAIQQIINEFMDMWRQGFGGWFKSARGADKDEGEIETKDGDDDKQNGNKVRSLEEARKKKKKKGKLANLIKGIIIGIALFLKTKLLLKLLALGLQVKFFLVALAGLLLNAARFYLDLKKGHQPQKVIYYEHAQHQHHYDGGEDDWSSSSSSGPGSSYWGRSYDEENEENTAQNLAYAKQKPKSAYYSRADSNSNNNPSSTWI